MKGFSCLLTVLLLAFTLPITHAQDSARGYPLTVAFFTNTVGLPGHANAFLFSIPLHPGVYIGTEHTWRTSGKHSWCQTAGISAYVIRELHYGVGLSSALIYRHRLPANFYWEAGMGLGYLHTFNYGPIFSLDDQGEYRRKRDWGRPHLAPDINAGLGFRFSLRKNRPVSVFMRYQFQAEYPFTIKGEIPVLPHSNFYIGTIFNPF